MGLLVFLLSMHKMWSEARNAQKSIPKKHLRKQSTLWLYSLYTYALQHPIGGVFLFHRLKFEFPYKFCVEIHYTWLRLISFQTEIIYFILCNWDRNYSEWFDKGTACDLFGVCDWCDNDRIYMVIEKVWCVCRQANGVKKGVSHSGMRGRIEKG